MKKTLLLLILQLLFSVSLLQAQGEVTPSLTIIEDLQEENSRTEGKIQIVSDPEISTLITSKRLNYSNLGSQQSIKVAGFRIQVFSGNDPRKSKSEALSKKRQIEERFADLGVYVSYRSPVWKLRVGNFRSRNEAYLYMKDLKKAFPEFAQEMTVFPDEIRLTVAE